MDAYLLDWANLLLRWAHVITAIAWIGSSFYFVFLDFSLTKPTDPALVDKGVDGELWAVHGAASTTRRSTSSHRNRCPRTCTGSTGKATRPG